jgi:phospholipase D1/2
LWAIDQAQHFIYVEQQFFISSMGNEGTVSNTIAKAIVSKVVEKFEQRKAAAKSGQDLGPSFRVIILIPQSPEGDFTSDAGVRAIMFFQSKTIRTMLNEIVARTGETEPGKLILFASLRAKGDVCGKMHTNQCYIHSKMLIVDDAVAIIGSANVNDRSLCGDRDSEICVCVRDVPQKSDSQKLSPIMQFRMQLWNRYCGLSIDDTTSRNAATFADEFVRKCMENTAIYEAATCFCMPSQNITNMAQYARLTEEARKAHDASPDNAREQLQKIGGLLVMFPVNFLKEDTQLTPR